jgi:hypothetical protein
MPFASYADLQTSVAGWLNRRNLTAQIPDFIRLAEADIASRLRDRRMVVTVTAPTDCGRLALPDDWVEAIDVRMAGAQTPLRYLPMSEANPARTAAFPPRFYTLQGNLLAVLPVPAENADGTFPDVQMTYYAKPTPLSDTVPTNWLLEQEPEALLYGSLLKAAPFMVDDERVPTWSALYKDCIDRLNLSTKVAVASGGPLVRGRRGFG